MNFDLEEQLVRTDITRGEAEERQRAYTVVEFSLGEKEKVGCVSSLSLSLSLSPASSHHLYNTFRK